MLIVLSALLSPTLSAAAPASNLLWLMSDSFDGRFFDPSAPQWDQVDLPNLRALAAKGSNFVRTYANSPQCVPSRCSMMTGRHTHHIGAWSNSMGLAHRFNDSTAARGRSCASAFNVTDCEATRDQPVVSPTDEHCKTAWNQSICEQIKSWQPNVSTATPDILRGLRNGGVDVAVFGKVDIGFGFLEEFENATVDGWHGGAMMSVQTRSADIRGPTKPDPRDMTSTTNDNVHGEDWTMVDRCLEWLGGHDAARDGWLLHCSLNIPHPPFQTNATWLSRVNASAVGVPASFTDVASMHPADAYATISKNVAGQFSADEVTRVRRVYAAMCAETDYLMGRVLDAAAATGHLGARTFVLFNSDHGEMAMEHRQVWKNPPSMPFHALPCLFNSDHGEMAMEHRQVWKNTMYEGSSRVPMMLAGPGVPAGARVTQLTQLLDVYPTLLHIFGQAAPAGMALDGASLLDAEALSARQHVVSQYHSNMINTGTFMLRTADGYKYLAFGTSPRGLETADAYPPQLFDVESDPDELVDLARKGGHEGLLAELDAQLRAVVDYPAADAQAKAVDHWLFDQWYVLANHTADLEETWREAYSQGGNFSKVAWAKEWKKAQAWMQL